MVSPSDGTAAHKSAENTDCNCRRGAHVGTARARPQRPRARVASHGNRDAGRRGRGGLECARRLRVRDRIGRRLWHGTEESFLLAATPRFLQSRPLSHITRYGITEHQNSSAKFSRKYRLQLQVGLGAHVGASSSTAAAPAGARGKPMTRRQRQRRRPRRRRQRRFWRLQRSTAGPEDRCSWRRMLGR